MAEDQSTLSAGGVEGGGNSPTPPLNKWANRPKVTIAKNERLKRNVLEINLDIDVKTAKIEKELLSKLFGRLGVKNGELEGFQIKRKKVFAWLVEGTDLSKFITDECIQIAPGMKTSVIKPMDKREVQVLISGININTPDSFLFSYLAFFGKVSSHKVIYDTERDGPLAGVKNGDRRFLVDFTAGRGMGTYHLVDGESVTVSYSGQRRTCGRCHRDARTCPGGGWARACEEKKTSRLELREHMRKLWAEIGFRTDDYELGSGEVVEEEVEVEAKSFTPQAKAPVSEEAKERFAAVKVRNLPDKTDMEDLMRVLEEHGLPKGMEEKVKLAKSGRKERTMAADVGPLQAEICNTLIENINRKVFAIWDKMLYCVGVSNLSPVKPAAPKSRPPPAVTTPSKNAPLLPSPPAEEPKSPSPPPPLNLSASGTLSLNLAAPAQPSVAHLAKVLPGVSIQSVSVTKRPTKAERKKAGKAKKAERAKPICVKTPGSSLLSSSCDEESSDEDESVTEEKKKVETKKIFRQDSSVNVKDVVDALNDVSKKHKISPLQSEGRRVRKKGESQTS